MRRYSIRPRQASVMSPRLTLPTFSVSFCLLWLLGLAAGCATLPPPIEKPYVEAIPATQETELGRIAAHCDPGGGLSAFRPLPLSSFAMDARLALVRGSQ